MVRKKLRIRKNDPLAIFFRKSNIFNLPTSIIWRFKRKKNLTPIFKVKQ